MRDDLIERALRAIAEGYAVSVRDDRYIVVENPDFQHDNGSDPNLVIDVSALRQPTAGVGVKKLNATVALADWSHIPKDIYVVGVKSHGDIVFDVTCCSVPMVAAPEVRYTRADLAYAAPAQHDGWRKDSPEKDGYYWVYQTVPPQSHPMQAAQWRKDRGWLSSWPVLAWMPLPAAPSTEGA